MHWQWDFYQVSYEDLLAEYKVDFEVLVNHTEHKTVRGVSRPNKAIDTGYYSLQLELMIHQD